MSLAPPDPVADLGLRGKIAVVTAAGRGIGRATALLLARWGATVIAVDRDAEALAPVVEEMVRLGGRAEAAPADVCDETAVAALFASVAERHGRVDILVNAVGGGKPAALETISAAEWDSDARLQRHELLSLRPGSRASHAGRRPDRQRRLAGGRQHQPTPRCALHQRAKPRSSASPAIWRGSWARAGSGKRHRPGSDAHRAHSRPDAPRAGTESRRRGCRSGGWPRPTIRPASSSSWPRHSPRTSPV